jgi:hypothetical protein
MYIRHINYIYQTHQVYVSLIPSNLSYFSHSPELHEHLPVYDTQDDDDDDMDVDNGDSLDDNGDYDVVVMMQYRLLRYLLLIIIYCSNR